MTTATIEDRINGLAAERPAAVPLHSVIDTDKLHALAADMETSGWHGAPVVYDSDSSEAITGSHRIAAAALAGLGEIPHGSIQDLADEYNIDWYALCADAGEWYGGVIALASALPTEVVEYLGLDAH